MAESKIKPAMKYGRLMENSNGYFAINGAAFYTTWFVHFNSNNTSTQFVFYSDGKVTLERYVDGAWKPDVILRPAD